MKIIKLKYKTLIDKVSEWNSKILKQASNENNTLLMVESYVLSEICNPSSQKDKIPFEQILKDKTPEDFIKLSPKIFIEFLFLMKKYRPDLYVEEISNLVNTYRLILEEIRNDTPNNATVFFMLLMISRLNEDFTISKKIPVVKVSEESFLLKSKSVIDKNLNDLLISANFGQKKIELTAITIEAIETIMLDATIKYDLILASKALKTLIYADATNSYITKLVYEFLCKNQSIEGYIGHYEAEFVKTNTQNIAQSQQVQITKELLLSIIEYNSDYRYINNFSSMI